ncbi:Uncharacterized protein FKW44_013302 [Caligus rogercresseyi]|uniref:Uncharacterized protein n=1 Tax=Caligus rogercresseyi TaxID=217165 RepID=A0A7T8KAW6_CALRO|nr:Uncharacterized protein FKW44_013302 [Caligus rogercresseyi]
MKFCRRLCGYHRTSYGFSIWGQVESQACRVRHSNVNYLKTSVEKKRKAMKRSYIITFCHV